jgi:class 3 adenylate cyclase
MQNKKPGILRHLAELIFQNKRLSSDNEMLHRQNESLAAEVDKYREMIASQGNLFENGVQTAPRKRNLVRFRTATVLYADITGIEKLQGGSSVSGVDRLDEIFVTLREIICRFQIHPIQSVGDNLIGVGGIPRKNITNPVEVLLAAVEMQYLIREIRRTEPGGNIWKLRIGIHTGPVMVGFSEKKHTVQEVKGDTVHLAARIRQFTDEGQILISATTCELVKDLFECEYFGIMPVKYKGETPLFIVRGIKPEYSLQGKGIIPNKRFSLRFGLMQFTDLQEVILDKLENELPPNLYYHNVKHTVDVVTQAELIGLGEGVSDEELLLLKTAALFHDSGHIISYAGHELQSTLLAREVLPYYYYTRMQVERICGLIMATMLPPAPRDRLEEIMCDADLDYLGRSDMIPVSNTLYLELHDRSMIRTINDWNRLQLRFISGHQYFTDTARNLREVNKQMQIERIKSLIPPEE